MKWRNYDIKNYYPSLGKNANIEQQKPETGLSVRVQLLATVKRCLQFNKVE